MSSSHKHGALSLIGTHLGARTFAWLSPALSVNLTVTGTRIGLGTYRVNGTVVPEQLELALTLSLDRGRRTRNQIRFPLFDLLFGPGVVLLYYLPTKLWDTRSDSQRHRSSLDAFTKTP
jgi:hypothetical protein